MSCMRTMLGWSRASSFGLPRQPLAQVRPLLEPAGEHLDRHDALLCHDIPAQIHFAQAATPDEADDDIIANPLPGARMP